MGDTCHCSTISVKKAVATGRLRAVREGDETAPTIIRAQNRQVKDASYFIIDGEYFMPDNDILKMLMGISPDFNINFLSKDLGSEIIGQSIEVPMHCAVIRSIKEHLNKYLDKIKISAHSPMVQASLF